MTVKDTIVGYKLHYLVALLGCVAAFYKLAGPIKEVRKLHTTQNRVGLFTKEELALYDGGPNSKGLYIAIMGSVFDVEAGSTHYGPDGSYHIFAAKDASKAFITGDFEEGSNDADIDDVLTLSGHDLLGVNNWQKFYEKTYTFKGYLIGR
jgi:predicted heme/steroid binding protein